MDGRIYYVNGAFVPAVEGSLPLNDLGLVRGYGVFDLLRTYDGVPFKLREHVARLERSAAAIGLDLPWGNDEIVAIARETYRRNELPNASIRIIVTGGTSPNFMTPQGKPSLIVMVEPVAPYAPEDYEQGAKLVSVTMERFLPTVKSLNYISAIMAMKLATPDGAIEALYRNAAGEVSECTRSNLFAVQGDRLITPRQDVLFGITRAVVMEIAADDFTVLEVPLHYDDLVRSDEVFITSTTKEILPIVQIDDHLIGWGRPGRHTQKLMQLFHAYTRLHRDA